MTPETIASRTTWHRENRRFLMAALDGVRAALSGEGGGAPVARTDGGAAEASSAHVPALQLVVEAFGLTPFERDVLLMCAGRDLDTEFARAVPVPTFGLALAKLPGAHWRALTPQAPLRRWHLISLGNGPTLTARPMAIAESVLHFLAGAPALDPELQIAIQPVSGQSPAGPLWTAGSRQQATTRVAAVLAAGSYLEAPIVQLTGQDATARRDVATAACEAAGLLLHELDARGIPADSGGRARLATRWERDARLLGSALLVTCDGLEGPDRAGSLEGFLQHLNGPVIVSAPDPLPVHVSRAVVTVPVLPLLPEEQAGLWHESLRRAAARIGRPELLQGLDGTAQTLIGQFNLGGPAIHAAAAEAVARLGRDNQSRQIPPSTEALGQALWDACRVQARPRLDDLAQRIEPAAVWDDLVLPPAEKRILAQIAAQVRQRYLVNETWGFAAKSRRGLGISALFAGISGTGKTMAAEVIAHALAVDLYRIDLSAVVSKYIGETEKNLRRIFDAAETGGAILLFDEADALFGKRSEVRDSHDRYANIEVSYLLQRMEAYRGLAILTSNRKQDLDEAFLRRIRFVVTFPFPGARERAEIWAHIFPVQTPTGGLDPARLAQLTITGGNIRSIAMGAAYLAADEGCPVQMRHILSAARTEYAKLDKPLSDAEIRGWQ